MERKIKTNKKERFVTGMGRISFVATTMMMIATSPAFAATNYVKNGATWVLGMVLWLCVIGTIGMAVLSAVKKEYSKAIIFIAVGGLLTFICAKPTVLINLGTAIGQAFGLS